MIFFIFGPNTQTFHRYFSIFPSLWKVFVKCWLSWILLQIPNRFSSKFSRIFIPFPIVILDLSHFLSAFDKFLNKMIEFIGKFSGFIRSLHTNWKIEFLKIFFETLQSGEIFLRKMDFSFKKNVAIFEKLTRFLILWIFLTFLTSFPSPPGPSVAERDTFKWPGCSPKESWWRHRTGRNYTVFRKSSIPV